MAYRALRHFKTSHGPVTPGDLVLGVEKWDEPVRRAHLDLEWIEQVPDPVPPPTPPAQDAAGSQQAAAPTPAAATHPASHQLHHKKGQKKR